MKTILAYGIVAVIAYALGCLNGAVFASRTYYQDDVRLHGSGNAGLTNFYRTYGAKYIVSVFSVDVGKALVALLLGGLLFSRMVAPESALIGRGFAFLFCVIGHIFPVSERFHGGKGVLCCGAAVWLIDWRIALIAWGIFLVLFLTTRYVSLGSTAAAVSLPITAYTFFADQPAVVFCLIAVGALVVFAHRENLSRLLRGEERRFRFRSEKEEVS